MSGIYRDDVELTAKVPKGTPLPGLRDKSILAEVCTAPLRHHLTPQQGTAARGPSSGKIWGANLDGLKGTVGVPRAKQAPVSLAAAWHLIWEVVDGNLEAILGKAVFSVKFRPNLLSSRITVYCDVQRFRDGGPSRMQNESRVELLLCLVLGT